MKFIITFIKNNERTLAEKKTELQIYINNLDETKTDSEKMSAAFLALPPRIVEVETRLKQALEDVGANFEKRASELEIEITQLREKISKYTDLAQTAMWVAVGGTAVMGLGGLLSLVPILGPVMFWGGAIVGLAAAVTDIIAASIGIAAINEYNRKVDELNQITKDSREFPQIKAQVNLAMNGCSDLCQRLSAIGGVWAVVSFISSLASFCD
ncbi:hypothetical protein BDZ94DRAFT_342847 [Collybia nuda]|uniref:Uncharacterized protein n=1 Tax=Collybia nuda TaxID=64659 RepID=A0A9P5YB33_9AGAR|nr:hypothetical protein BDZ94DRAFT_342847 [Collybia nuda]